MKLWELINLNMNVDFSFVRFWGCHLEVISARAQDIILYNEFEN